MKKLTGATILFFVVGILVVFFALIFMGYNPRTGGFITFGSALLFFIWIGGLFFKEVVEDNRLEEVVDISKIFLKGLSEIYKEYKEDIKVEEKESFKTSKKKNNKYTEKKKEVEVERFLNKSELTFDEKNSKKTALPHLP
jgi:flagellar motor component MotA